MKHLLLALALSLGVLVSFPPAYVSADSDSDSGGGSWSSASGVPELDPAVGGSALVLLLGGVAYLASRRRDRD